MKYLEDPKLAAINKLFHSVQCGDRIINGRVDAFTCKRGTDDKRSAHLLNQRFDEDETIDGTNSGKKGKFADCGKRRVLIDLILTLNASFQDYDFSEVRPHHFLRIKPTEVIASINERLNEVAVNGSSTRNTRANFLQMLWTSIDEVIVLDECEVYSFLLPPDGDGDDYQFLLSDEDNDCNEDHHLLWSFNFFFYNRSMKRMVFFTCTESSLLPACDAMEEDSNVGQYYFPRGSTDDDQMDASDGYFSKWQRHQYSVDDPDELYGFDMEAGQSDTPDFVV